MTAFDPFSALAGLPVRVTFGRGIAYGTLVYADSEWIALEDQHGACEFIARRSVRSIRQLHAFEIRDLEVMASFDPRTVREVKP